jgi:hypothetical protein
MRRMMLGARALFAAVLMALLCSCGGNNTYSPDFSGGATPSLSVTVGPSSVTTNAGQNAVFTVTVSGSPGCSDSVTLSVSGLPDGAAASFSPSSVTPTPQGVTSTLTITIQAGTGNLNGDIRSAQGESSRAGRAVSTITVTASGCGLSDTGSAQLDVQSPSNLSLNTPDQAKGALTSRAASGTRGQISGIRVERTGLRS